MKWGDHVKEWIAQGYKEGYSEGRNDGYDQAVIDISTVLGSAVLTGVLCWACTKDDTPSTPRRVGHGNF